MLAFVIRRLGTMVLTMLCLTLVVFFLVNLEPNLKKLAISQTEMRTSAEQLESWLVNATAIARISSSATASGSASCRSSRSSIRRRARPAPRFRFCNEPVEPTFSGILQGDFGCSTKFKTTVAAKLFPALGATGILMFWVMVDDGADRAADRHPGRHARGLADGPNAVGRLDRHDGDAGICVGRHLHRHLRLVARLAQRLGRDGDQRRASPSTISRCR